MGNLFLTNSLSTLRDRQRNKISIRLSNAADGNFLFAHLVLEQYQHNFDHLLNMKLPVGLCDVYRDFLNRELGADENRWNKVFKPLLGLLAIAQGEGLTAAQIGRILGREEVEQELRVCKQFLDGELPVGPFRLFHRSFVHFLLENESNSHYHIDPVIMHHKIVKHYLNQYKNDWRRCDTYGLNNLVTHIIRTGDCESLGRLVAEHFLEEKANLLGDVDALSDAGDMARVLGDGGEDHWNALIQCAFAYCGFLERIRRQQQSLESLIEQGEISSIQLFVDSEDDEGRRGLLLLAISILLADAGYTDTATEFKARADTIITPRLRSNDPGNRRYSYEYKLLALSLTEHINGCTEEHGIHQETPSFEQDSDEKDSVQMDSTTIESRTVVPLRYVLLAYLASSSFGFINIGVWFLCVLYFFKMTAFIFPYHVESKAEGLLAFLLFFGICIFWICVFASVVFFFRKFLARHSKAIDCIFNGLANGYCDASPLVQRSILRRAMRYQTMLSNSAFRDKSTINQQPWLHVIHRLIISRVRNCSDLDEVAQLIGDAIGMDRHICDALIIELSHMASKDLEMVIRKVAEHSHWRSHFWDRQFLRILVGTSPTIILPDLLFNAIPYGTYTDTKGTTNSLLRTLTPSLLAKVILAGLYQPSCSFPSLLQNLTYIFKAVMWKIRSVMNSPLHTLEPFLLILLYVPGLLTTSQIVICSVLDSIFVCFLVFFSPLFGYSYDSLRLLSLPRGTPIWQYAAYVNTQTKKDPFCSFLTSLFFNGKKLRETMLALQITGKDFSKSTTFENYSSHESRRVLLALSRAGMMGHEIILSIMGNRVLLNAASTFLHNLKKDRHIQQIGPQECDEQLRRVLPIRSKRQSLMLVMVLSASFITIWMFTLYVLTPTSNTLLQPLVLTTFSFGIYFAVCQHVVPVHHEIMIAKAMIVLIVAIVVPLPYYYFCHIKKELLEVHLLGVVTAVIITNLLVPRFISSWRSAGLFFPKKSQLLLQRFVSILIALGISGALASIGWLLIKGSITSLLKLHF